ncbi:hypothetical protein N7524_006468 [Penicillium chrysogenum]|nr:hypothetical protein N7524_006468 [Penicillium chrysogenum]
MPLGSIKDDLTTLLNHHTLSQIQVEVINGDHFYVPTLFPIQSTAELAVAFHHLKDDIVQLLDEALGTRWQLVSPFNVGKDSRSARPALVVGVLPSTKANCHQLQPSSPNTSSFSLGNSTSRGKLNESPPLTFAFAFSAYTCFLFLCSSAVCFIWCYLRLPEAFGLSYLEIDILKGRLNYVASLENSNGT